MRKQILGWALVLMMLITLMPSGVLAANFTDVQADAYYAEPVDWALKENITNGTSETTFSPEVTCTRGQVVTFLWRAADEPEPTTDANPFADVDVNAYYGKAVLWAVEKDITKGTGATTFSPDDTCTRGQIVTFLYRDEQSKKAEPVVPEEPSAQPQPSEQPAEPTDPSAEKMIYFVSKEAWTQSMQDGSTYSWGYTWKYDSHGNNLQMNHIFGSTEEVEEEKTYDAAGNVLSHIYYSYPGEGEVETSSSTYTYDESGNLLNEKKSNGEEKQYTYNSRGWLIQELYKRDPNMFYSGDLTTNYTYDSDGNVVKVQADNGYLCEYAYDPNGAWKTSHITYTNFGSDVEHTYVYKYDANGNVIHETYTGSWSDYERTYTYDAEGRMLTEETIYDNNERYFESWSYNEHGDVLVHVNEKSGTVFTTNYSYTYDENGNVQTMQYAEYTGDKLSNQFSVRYEYTAIPESQLSPNHQPPMMYGKG